MARHLVTVCMFCLMCAAHVCGTHMDNGAAVAHQPKPEYQHMQVELNERRQLESRLRYQDRLLKIRHGERVRRHAPAKVDPEDYVDKIFETYGDSERREMNMTEFNRMVDALDLHLLVTGGVQDNRNKPYMILVDHEEEEIVKCLNSTELVTRVNSRLKDQSHSHEHTDHPHEEHRNDEIVTKATLDRLCPTLLYQKLVSNNALGKNGCIDERLIHAEGDHSLMLGTRDKSKETASKNMVQVWLYSTLSIIAISACGLLGVAVIPIMHKTYYNHLLQFLVALAVGTLCGDALLHLLPHAMSPLEHSHVHGQLAQLDPSVSHNDGMWKGLAAMLGVVFFYFMEKGLTVVAEWRKRRQKLEDDKLPSRVRVLKDETVGGCSGGSKAPIANSTSSTLLKIFKREDKSDPTTKTCKHKYSEYPYCYDEIDTDTHDDHHMRDGQVLPSPKVPKNHNNSVSVVSSNALNREGKEGEPTAKDWLLKGEATPAAVEMNNIKRKEEGAKDLKDGDSYTVILREHSRAHHGHSHAHGHVHAPPSSLSSVAWMVIMGDGLHNFTDGMAIGAAFASGLAGGFSTAIAVLCHELPHELGDFAVLLKAGMSVRRAVCYNVLSSALCLAGMVCGVAVGNAPHATRWLFAVAAGTFLYIALVDMMPELSTSHSKEGTFCQCVLQLGGLLTGVGIMLLIAVYEHDLKNLFG